LWKYDNTCNIILLNKWLDEDKWSFTWTHDKTYHDILRIKAFPLYPTFYFSQQEAIATRYEAGFRKVLTGHIWSIKALCAKHNPYIKGFFTASRVLLEVPKSENISRNYVDHFLSTSSLSNILISSDLSS
jgi:hypothetical protein